MARDHAGLLAEHGEQLRLPLVVAEEVTELLGGGDEDDATGSRGRVTLATMAALSFPLSLEFGAFNM